MSSDAIKARVFVSYAREDKDVALRISDTLEAAGVPVWIDEHHIPPGQRWDAAVQQALEHCVSLLVVLTPTSVKSENVLDEVNYALSQNRLVVPVIAEPCEVPFRLHRLQYVDLTRDPEQGYARLSEHLGSATQLGSSVGPRELRASQPSVSRRSTWSWTLAAAGALALCVLVWRGWPVETPDPVATKTGLGNAPPSAAKISAPTVGLRTFELFYAQDAQESRNLATHGLWDVTVKSFEAALAQPGVLDKDRIHWQAGLELARGRVAELDGKREQATTLTRHALELEPKWSIAHLLLADLLNSQGQHEQAAEHAVQAELMDDKLWRAQVMLAAIRAAQNKRLEAISELQRALAKAPGAVLVHSSLALAYHFATGYDSSAIATAKRALELDPQLVSPRIVLIEIALEQHETAQALQHSEEMLPNAGESVAAWLARGDAAAAAGKTAEARIAWERALALRKQYGDQTAPRGRLNQVADALAQGGLPPERFPRDEQRSANPRTPPGALPSPGSASAAQRAAPVVEKTPVARPAESRTAPSPAPGRVNPEEF